MKKETKETKKNPRVTDKICPKCGHKHMWSPRTLAFNYQYKCCKCGNKIKGVE